MASLRAELRGIAALAFDLAPCSLEWQALHL
jgi:hypothetical protein